jgi:hypothetical protein
MSNFSIKDESSNHKYRTELPNIIFELGLSPSAFALYAAIKRCAGDSGVCTRSTTNLAKMANMSPRTLQRTLPELLEKNKFIKKSLVKLTPRISDCGDQDTNELTINDIWPENAQYFLNNIKGGDKLTVPPVKMTPGGVKMTGGVVTNCQGGGDKLTDKEEPIKKNLYEEEQHTPKAPIKFGVCVSLFSLDYEKFCQEHGKVKIDLLIEEMNDYCQAHGKTYKGAAGYAAAMRNWLRRRKQDPKSQNSNTDRRTQNKDGSPIASPADGRF